MLARLEQRLTWEGVTNAVAVLGDVTHTPFEPDSFDAAFLVTVLGEIPDRTAALRELHRVLKLGGRLSISEVLVDPDYQPHEMVRRLCAEAGFRPTDMHGNVLAYTANFVKA
jgi:ubiquinone/menaquinone biosynthesis C-methylase UbiE